MASRPGQTASLLFYVSVLAVAASTVVFGLDWLRAPMLPMPETEASVQAAKLAANLPPPRKVVVAKAKPRSVYPARTAPKPAPQQGQATAARGPAPQSGQNAPTAPTNTAPEATAQQAPAAPAQQPPCDIAACSAAHRSFRASDCTWQPYDGPRRLCTKGQPQQQEANAATVDPSQFSNKCDIAACRSAYFTFDPTDCTYQPSNGPRRLCAKGTPPKPEGAAETANAAPAQVSNKCDQEACKRAYVTFDPADCTYKPTLYGPRAVCTKGSPPKPQAKDEPAAAPAAPAAPNAAPSSAPVEAKTEQPAPPKASDKCDVDACKQAYTSFDPADCTYQPPEGPRTLCSKGAPPKPEAKTEPAAAPAPNVSPPPDAAPNVAPAATPTAEQAKPPETAPGPAAAAPAPAAATPAPASTANPATPETPAAAAAPTAAPGAAASPPAAPPSNAASSNPPPSPSAENTNPPPPKVSDKCDIDACKRAYFTFDPADCTYRPSNGPRRLCTRGTPPKPETKAEPAPPSPPVAAAAPEAPAAPAQASDKCDIDACKRAYISFSPVDCTYQPSDGPRRLCTKGAPPKPQAKTEPATSAPKPVDAARRAHPAPVRAPNHPVPPGFVPSGR